jgi:preprotein translocase subunit SecB
MSEPTNAAGGGQEQPPLVINFQYARDVSFEVPHAPGIYMEMRSAPEISVNVDVQAHPIDEGRGLFEVRLKLGAEGKLGEKAAFIAELDYGAAVTINAPEDHRYPLLLVEAPRHMFPFARNMLADMTRDGGFPPIVLQPIDFVALFRQRVQAAQQAKQAAGTPPAGGGNGGVA